MLLKKVNEKTYKRISTPQDIQLQSRRNITGEIYGVSSFYRGEYVQITPTIYGQGYFELKHDVSVAASVLAYKGDGSALTNKASGYGAPNFEIYRNFFIFKSGITIGGYTSEGLVTNLSIGDEVFVYYGFGLAPQLKQQTIVLTSTIYGQGYANLDNKVAFPEHAIALIVGGHFLVNRFSYTNTAGDFLIYDNKFVFKNGIDLGGYVSESLSEVLLEGDRIVLIHM